jgi:hypothetical protein
LILTHRERSLRAMSRRKPNRAFYLCLGRGFGSGLALSLCTGAVVVWSVFRLNIFTLLAFSTHPTASSFRRFSNCAKSAPKSTYIRNCSARGDRSPAADTATEEGPGAALSVQQSNHGLGLLPCERVCLQLRDPQPDVQGCESNFRMPKQLN